LGQDGCALPSQTVSECVHFEVRARRPNWPRNSEVEREIEGILAKLRIINIKNVRLDWISGGEKKRVMITVGLCMEAEILILDDPTSGLNANIALEMTNMLKEYAVKTTE